jgi:hypothetical protein
VTIARILSLFLLLLAAPAVAQPAPEITTLAVAPGAGGASISRQVELGGRDLFYVNGQALQAMTVTVTSANNTASFQIYAPGTLIYRGYDGAYTFTGNTLPDAGKNSRAALWEGVLPQNGLYLIVVGATVDNASYQMTVTLQ